MYRKRAASGRRRVQESRMLRAVITVVACAQVATTNLCIYHPMPLLPFCRAVVLPLCPCIFEKRRQQPRTGRLYGTGRIQPRFGDIQAAGAGRIVIWLACAHRRPRGFVSNSLAVGGLSSVYAEARCSKDQESVDVDAWTNFDVC